MPLEPMLAHPTDIELARTRQKQWAMEPKLDGVRCIITRHRTKLTLTSRSGKSYTEKLPRLVEQLFDLLPPQTVLDCELGYPVARFDSALPCLDFNRTMRVLGSGPDVAFNKWRLNLPDVITPYVFDVLYWEGEDLTEQPLWDRRVKVDWLHDELDMVVTPYMEYFDEATYNAYVDAGGEGVMLNNPNGRYQPGKRPSQNWYKLKKYDTVDAHLTGQVLPGQGKYEGGVGAVYFKTEEGDTGKCSGMDDLTREHMTAMWLQGILEGKAIEVKYFGRVGQGEEGLRHPNFVRWRPDKDKETT
jgi:ATP-dependent DNA ligase